MTSAPKAVSDKQRQLSEWFALRQRAPIPDGVFEDSKAWWRWVHSLVRRVHRDIAREMEHDFNLNVDYTDPISIIGAIKYEQAVAHTESARSREDVLNEAATALTRGQDAWHVADEVDLSETELVALIRQVEASGHLVPSYF